MSDDLISRKALLEKAWDVPYETESAHFVQVVDVADIQAAPAVEAVPVVYAQVPLDSSSNCNIEPSPLSDFHR